MEGGKRDQRRLLYLPEKFLGSNSGNSYTEMMVRSWEALGFQPILTPHGFANKLQAVRLRGSTVGVLNWVDNCVIDQAGNISLRGLWLFWSIIFKMRLVCGTLVFVRHNVFPHNTTAENQDKVRAVIDWSERMFFDRVMVHSKHYAIVGRHYVPMPIYEFASPGQTHEPSPQFIFFGSVVPYKRLETLMDAWQRDDIQLLIAGRADPDYVALLRERARGKRIQFVSDRLSDEAARDLLRQSAAAVIPHDGADMIVSASIYFALSSGVPVICCANRHAQELLEAGVLGVLALPTVAAINDLALSSILELDRVAIENKARQQFGRSAVSQALNAMLEGTSSQSVTKA